MSETRIALVGGRVFPATGGPLLEVGTVILNGKTIEAVGSPQTTPLPEGCQQLDARGLTILPGFIDGHQHLGADPGPLDVTGHIRENLRAAGKLQQCLRWGTTAVGHAAGAPENIPLRTAIEEGTISGCARLLVGAVVNATGGHVRGRSADGPWEIRRAVREMVAANVDFIKTCASGGFQWAHESLSREDYTYEELRTLVDEAHSKGKRVHVHAHAQPGLRNAIEAGCDVILHGANIDDEALHAIAAKGLWYMPTLFITSETVTNTWNLPPHMTDRMRAANPIHRVGVRKAHALGVKIATGTDGRPGSLMAELGELVACGLSPTEAILAGTRNAAEAMGILDEVGTIEPGKTADLIALRGDPFAAIASLLRQETVALVIKGGVVEVDRRGEGEER